MGNGFSILFLESLVFQQLQTVYMEHESIHRLNQVTIKQVMISGKWYYLQTVL